MTITAQETSIRYHLHMVGLLSGRKIAGSAFKHRELLIGFAFGIFITMVAYGLNSPAFQQMGYEAPTLTTASPLPLDNTYAEIIDTELLGNYTHGFNFTGRFIANNEPVTTFECNFNSDQFESCTTPYTIETIARGNHTFEVRSVLSNGTVDPTPAAAIWSVK